MDQTSFLNKFQELPKVLRGEEPADFISLVLLGVVGLVVLLLLVWLLRALFRRRKPKRDNWDKDLRIELDDCPLPVAPAGVRGLTLYHLPVRLRLVVLAPLGKEGQIDATAVEKLLDLVIPGLGGLAQRDRPRIRIWPAQMSQHGFHATFHRNTPKAAGRGESSRWVLVSGRIQAARQPILLGLGLWADQPNTLDRITLEPNQWLDVLRIRNPEK
jgi:hypothetical protein